MPPLLRLTLLAAASCCLRAQPPAGEYPVILWSTGEPLDRNLWFQRLREMGVTAEQCTRGCDPAPFAQQGLRFYVENLVSDLAFHHARRKLYEEDRRNYVRTRDRSNLERRPCFHDPAFWQRWSRQLPMDAAIYAPHRPLFYDLRDEPSIGSFTSPTDYCFCPHTLRAFREWLQKHYTSLESLNRQWETRFGSWAEVMPMTTFEVKDRERRALALGRPENYAPWADHRAFMDETFASTLDRLRTLIRQADPSALVGIAGTQMPSAWGGYDLWKLSQVIDWVEPYDIAGSREIFRSFLPPGTPVMHTVFGSDMNRIRRRLWWDLLHGGRGAIIWDDEQSRTIGKREPGMPITARGRGLAEVFAEIRAFAPKLFPLERLHDRIAIHYSQASIRAHWMLESREDGDTWPRRLSTFEAEHSRHARVRDGFLRVIEDLGLQANYVSYEQIERDELRRAGYRVLLLPQSVAISEKECRAIEEFARAGGTVIADNMTATMDEHGRRLPEGQLDGLFGIRRSRASRTLMAAGGRLPGTTLGGFERGLTLLQHGSHLLTDSGEPVLIEKAAGRGRAIYLNLAVQGYGRERLLSGGGDDLRRLMRRLLANAGVRPEVSVSGAAGVEVIRYRGAGGDYLALMRNPDFSAENRELERPARITVTMPERRLDVQLDPRRPVLMGWAEAHPARPRAK